MDNKLIIGKNEQMSEARRAALTFDIETMPDISQPGEMKIQLSVRGAFILELSKIAWNENADPDLRAEADKAAEILSAHVRDVKIIPVSDKKYQIEFEPYPDRQDIRDLVEQVFRTVAFNICFQSLIASPQSDGDKQAKKRAPKTQLIPKGAYPLSKAVIDGLPTARTENGEPLTQNMLDTPALCKMEHVLLVLLSQTSPASNPKDPKYFTGNAGYVVEEMEVSQGGVSTWEKFKMATTIINIQDIFKQWNPGKKLGATDRKFILKTLSEYKSKSFEWVFEVGGPNGSKIPLKTTDLRIRIIQQIGTPDVLYLKFHPAFSMAAFGAMYSNTPERLHCVLEQAAGGGKSVTAAHWWLFHYFNGLASIGKTSTELYENLLFEKGGFSLKWRNAARERKMLTKVLNDLIKTSLLKNWHTVETPKGVKYVISILAQKGGIRDAKRGDS